tara:strand:+ start:98 stop:355 length:258 start_codon:yes stop_codon:yes gene_type:complete
LEFRTGVRNDFAVIFDGGQEKTNQKIPTENFAEKWGWFGVMHRLCNQDISKLENITKLSLLECLTWLTYEIDLNTQNNVNYGSKE